MPSSARSRETSSSSRTAARRTPPPSQPPCPTRSAWWTWFRTPRRTSPTSTATGISTPSWGAGSATSSTSGTPAVRARRPSRRRSWTRSASATSAPTPLLRSQTWTGTATSTSWPATSPAGSRCFENVRHAATVPFFVGPAASNPFGVSAARGRARGHRCRLGPRPLLGHDLLREHRRCGRARVRGGGAPALRPAEHGAAPTSATWMPMATRTRCSAGSTATSPTWRTRARPRLRPSRWAARTPSASRTSARWATPDLADVDGDGDLDVLVGAYDGNTRLFENTGTAAAPAFAAPLGESPRPRRRGNAFLARERRCRRRRRPRRARRGQDAAHRSVREPPARPRRLHRRPRQRRRRPHRPRPRRRLRERERHQRALRPPVRQRPRRRRRRQDRLARRRHGRPALHRLLLRRHASCRRRPGPAAASDRSCRCSGRCSRPSPKAQTPRLNAHGPAVVGCESACRPRPRTGSCARPAWSWPGSASVRGAYRTDVAPHRARPRAACRRGCLARGGAARRAGRPRLGADLPAAAPLRSGRWDVPQPAFADIDGDGDLDAFAGAADGYTLFFENTGQRRPHRRSLRPQLNAFGLPDVQQPARRRPSRTSTPTATSTPSWETLSAQTILFREHGDGERAGLRAGADATLRPRRRQRRASPAFADLDADGDLDAFIGNELGQYVLLPRTRGTATRARLRGGARPTPSASPDVGAASPAPRSPTSTATATSTRLIGAVLAARRSLLREHGQRRARRAFAAPSIDPFVAPELRRRGLARPLADLDGDGDLDALLGALRRGRGARPSRTPASGERRRPSRRRATHSARRRRSLSAAPDLRRPRRRRRSRRLRRRVHGGGIALPPQHGHARPRPLSLRPPRTRSASSTRATSNAPAFADLDGDGDLDVFTAVAGRQHHLLREHRDRRRPRPSARRSTNPFGLSRTCGTAARCRPSPTSTATATSTRLVGDRGRPTSFFFREYGHGERASLRRRPSMNPFGLVERRRSRPRPTVADVDGDGDLDALIGSDDGQRHPLLRTRARVERTGLRRAGASAPSASSRSSASPPPPRSPTSMATATSTPSSASTAGGLILFENVAIDPDACTDGLDNDGDGRIDLGPDPGCANAADTSELSAPPVRQRPRRRRRRQDRPAQRRHAATRTAAAARRTPSCRRRPPPGCGLGPELLLLGPLLAAVRRRRGSYTAPSCPSPTPPPTSSSSAAR